MTGGALCKQHSIQSDTEVVVSREQLKYAKKFECKIK